MSISEKDLKLLWSRSGGMCAFPSCKQRLTVDSSTSYQFHVIGEQAHIVARSEDGPRGSSRLTLEERDSYANSILLCPTHHSLIDKNTCDFPAERLYKMKINHEAWACSRDSSLPWKEQIVDVLEEVEADNNQEYLMKILQIALDNRETSRKNRLVKQAGFYAMKTFEDFSFEEIRLPQDLSPEELKKASFVDEKKNLILYGMLVLESIACSGNQFRSLQAKQGGSFLQNGCAGEPSFRSAEEVRTKRLHENANESSI